MKYVFIVTLAIVLVGCGHQAERTDDTKIVETENSSSIQLRNMDVKVKDKQIHLSGEVTATNNRIYYELIQGEQVIREETAITLNEGSHGWSKVEINTTLSKTAVTNQDPPIFKFYGKDKSGKEINPNYIPVDLNNQ